MDEIAERPGLFAKGGVGRFLLGLTVGGITFGFCTCGVTSVISTIGSLGVVATQWDDLEAARTEGTAFAVGHTITECVNEMERRGSATCTVLTPMCSITLGNFAEKCVQAATDDGYCATVPSDLWDISASVVWQQKVCAGIGGSWCTQAMGNVATACRARTPKATDTPDAPAEVE
jgi:hypothetical protein